MFQELERIINELLNNITCCYHFFQFITRIKNKIQVFGVVDEPKQMKLFDIIFFFFVFFAASSRAHGGSVSSLECRQDD